MKPLTIYERLLRDAHALATALKGCRDAIDRVPEGVRGNHDSKLNRALRRADAALKQYEGK
jgi:hypothetical protein